jgi:hypothetical protein
VVLSLVAEPGDVGRQAIPQRDRVLQDEALTTEQWPSAQELTPTDGTCPVEYGSWETPYDWNAATPTTPLRVTFTPSNNRRRHPDADRLRQRPRRT